MLKEKKVFCFFFSKKKKALSFLERKETKELFSFKGGSAWRG
jgi:hypothetical protein